MRADALLRGDDYIVNPTDIHQDTLVLTDDSGSVTALPIRNRLMILLWSPNAKERTIQETIDNLALAGFRGPFRTCRIADALGMIMYYADEPGYLLLLDAPVRYCGSGTRIGQATYAQG